MADGERKIAVLGTGIMGGAMARNLVAAGLEVHVWNRTRDRAEAIEGATVAGSPAEAAADCPLVLTMLSDGSAVDEVMTGEGGALAAMGAGAVWIQSSTVGVAWCDRLAAAAAEAGVGFVDAPVLGTRQPAEKGELIVLAGGDEALRPRCAPAFEAVGKKTAWVGGVGAASRLKLVVNNWIVGLLGALGESIALAEKLDVDPATFLETIAGGPLDAGYAQLKGKAMIAGEYPPAFPLALAHKDARLVIEAAEASGLDLRAIRGVAELFARAEERGRGDEDMAALVEALR